MYYSVYVCVLVRMYVCILVCMLESVHVNVPGARDDSKDKKAAQKKKVCMYAL